MCGVLVFEGWGLDAGYAALRWDPSAPAVQVWVFCSPDLPAFWSALDDFEGPDYYRALVPVWNGKGRLLGIANLYAVT